MNTAGKYKLLNDSIQLNEVIHIVLGGPCLQRLDCAVHT